VEGLIDDVRLIVGVAPAEGVADPPSETLSGLFGTEAVTYKTPEVANPWKVSTVGTNLTEIVHVAPAASVAGQLFVAAKFSDVCTPLNVKEALPVLVSVTF
jgi:hypothetical protein